MESIVEVTKQNTQKKVTELEQYNIAEQIFVETLVTENLKNNLERKAATIDREHRENLMPALPLNSQNLPYPDPLHPIVVHFVIAMVFFSYFCDVVGYFTRNLRFLEVGFWNLFVAAIAIFIAIIFGQLEAGLALVYPAV